MIERIQIRNYKAFRDVDLRGLSPLCVFIGANGSGKSTLFDVFAFLRDALQQDVVGAVERRGGWSALCSRDKTDEPIALQLDYWVEWGGYRRLARYELTIAFARRTYSVREKLAIRGQNGNWEDQLNAEDGQGVAYDDGIHFGVSAPADVMQIRLESSATLSLKPLSQYVQFRALVSLRKRLESFIVFEPDTTSLLTPTKVDISTHLESRGQNLTRVAKYLYDDHPELFAAGVAKLARRIPGLRGVRIQEAIDKRIVLGFEDENFDDPFLPRYISDGSLKMFAYLLLISHPEPNPLLAIEEPENYIHPDLHQLLAEELRVYGRRAGQVFVSTHSRDFLNGLDITELYWMEKADGYTTIRRAVDDPMAKALFDAGDQLGYLWRTNHFSGSGPLNAAVR
jgi:predicted ATPase